MLDTITYIPTILAYAFITLLVVILSFIVIYVSHKVYISIYDNLPVPNSMSWSVRGSTTPDHTQNHGADVLEKRGPLMRKSKTAIQFIVTFEECYLAYVLFETGRRPDPQTGSSRRSTVTATPRSSSATATANNNNNNNIINSTNAAAVNTFNAQHHIVPPNCLVKYYDRLSAIPILRPCQTPSGRPTLTALDSVLNAVLQNNITARKATTPSAQ